MCAGFYSTQLAGDYNLTLTVEGPDNGATNKPRPVGFPEHGEVLMGFGTVSGTAPIQGNPNFHIGSFWVFGSGVYRGTVNARFRLHRDVPPLARKVPWYEPLLKRLGLKARSETASKSYKCAYTLPFEVRVSERSFHR